MIPSLLARHIEQGVKDFLQTTFPVTNPFFAGLLEEFLTRPGNLFRGPFLDLQLPFLPGRGAADLFPDLELSSFTPWLHQEKAFARLAGPEPRSTLIATGTGSGKTECFLYPLLQYCYQHRGEPGIKAILIYPMNALAADQAGRIAGLIHDSRLRGQVRAGVYVGQADEQASSVMQPERLITDKQSLRLMPPDILLTNYKMLDYLLTRPDDRPLWQQNGPDTLRFLVVDELHTFDGAQGTDLGCLIRRLKARLAVAPGHLCCVGTSATLGGDDDHGGLLEYAEAVFGERFQDDAVITEARLRAGEFLDDSPVDRIDIVPPEHAARLDPANYADLEEYIRAQHRLWLGSEIPENFAAWQWRVELGKALKGHLLFQNLLKILGGRIVALDELLERLGRVTPGFEEYEQELRLKLLNSLLALVSMARTAGPESAAEAEVRPFLHVRVQLWLREMRRMVGTVGTPPRLDFADDLNEEQLQRRLPLIHCRECGSMGWSGLKPKYEPRVSGELEKFYPAFFKKDASGRPAPDPTVVYIFPVADCKAGPDGAGPEHYYFCPDCFRVIDQVDARQCPACGRAGLLLVHIPASRTQRKQVLLSLNRCPYCDTEGSLTLLGSRAASLTSVMIVQLFSSGFNRDKRLLTFSDNVQDAAHRAGFFNARTYRFNFRTALQKVVAERGEGSSLARLPQIFIDYWSERLDEPSYIAAFLAPNMEWLRDYERLKSEGRLPEDSSLRSLVDKRIAWEIGSEYGFQARIGRTLEKTSSSVIGLDPEIRQRIVTELSERLRNEFGEFRQLEEQTLLRFILGLLIHLKNRGALLLPGLTAYVADCGNTYLLNREHWLPGFGPASRAPVFLTTRRDTRFDQLLSRSAGRCTWYEVWQAKNFLLPEGRLAPDVTRDLYALVLEGLEAAGILEKRVLKSDAVWGLRPAALRVTTRVGQLRCEQCGHSLAVTADEAELLAGSPCQAFNCAGRYRQVESGDSDYYGKLYASGDLARIFAEEHTGLLARSDREKLEACFKAEGRRRRPWYPNLLSCTPTLEMGIDIGSLSSLVLCSVPPAQANYLQRIGRAGRRDGNALNLVVANARPHDLYFFAAPEEMMAGSLDTPGIYLEASAVLERQFTAFCFDRWITARPEVSLPRRLGQVLSNLEPVDPKKFPHSFLAFLDLHQGELLESFFALFTAPAGQGLAPAVRERLKGFVYGEREREDSLRYRISNGLHARLRERNSLRRKVKVLSGKIKRKKLAPRDRNFERELRELEIEKSALQALVRNIGDRDVFNFLTDEGLLPNYAFPEIGVVLKSLIYRRKTKSDGEKSGYETWSYEYERPAASAIAELAPENSFYAGGRRVRIDQVDMSVSEIENWRFCDRCTYRELLGQKEETSSCPRCGSPMWSDEGQKRQMLRLRQVFASTDDRKSRIGDDSDDREPLFYQKQMMVDFDREQVIEAFKVDGDFPFGFDFLARAEFTEVNFGEKREIGEKVTIAGEDVVRPGFALCRVCGKVQKRFGGEPVHAFSCTVRDQSSERNLTDCFYLYRQFVSEAIRILLPVSIIAGSDRKLQSFIAALQLGLKRKFRGRIDHLQVTTCEEPLPESSFKRKFLVLYDTVPGGTGYLKQLLRPDQLMEILELALNALKSCACNRDDERDGCYRCLYAYRNSYNMPLTSRDTAIALLDEILEYRERLVKTENISLIPLNTLIESELEARFLEALRQAGSETLPVSLKKDVVNGKPGYFLQIGEHPYYIELQVEFGELDGVRIPSRADFVIRPARSRSGVKPVVVFLDGLTYHRNRLGRDTAQRLALLQSRRYRVWSLSWDDVERSSARSQPFFRDYLDPARLPAGDRFAPLLEGYGLSCCREWVKRDSFTLLLNYLARPDEEQWRRFVFVWSLLQIGGGAADPEKATLWRQRVRELFPDDDAGWLTPAAGDGRLYGASEFSESSSGRIAVRQFLSLEPKALAPPGHPGAVWFGCYLDDDEGWREAEEFKYVWNGFLRLVNLGQFLPGFVFVTGSGVQNQAYDRLELFAELPGSVVAQPPSAPETVPVAAWEELKELTGPELHPLLEVLQRRGWPPPVAGFELADEGGEIVAQAELAWEDWRLALLTSEELACRERFIAAGWRVEALAQLLDDPERLARPGVERGD